MTADVHRDWTTTAFDRLPVAEAVGPFAGRAMLQTWWDIRGTGELLLLESPDALLAMSRNENTISLLGEADLFDYHSPLGGDVGKLVATWAAALPSGIELNFDSLPSEAADVVMAGLTEAGLAPVATVHQSAAVLDLPSDFETYLAGLDKKQRHETRRKTRRFTEMLGAPRLLRDHGAVAVARFAAMHRLAAGDKGTFMDPSMEALFGGLHTDAGAVIDFLYGDSDEPVAAAFGFEDESAYYLYNSSYAPEASAASPGIVLVAELIRQTVEVGHGRFDFLKGDEVYKYRLGAVARPLWRIATGTGAGSQ
jgi:CelD/BcsL family acetyltransferase involved in cellulose biosynthesis